MADSNRAKAKKEQQTKFPLSFHKGSGQYRKKIAGKDHYFGTDPDKALATWLREKDDLLAGRTPKPFEGDTLDLKTLCNFFLADKEAKRDSDEITNRHYSDYFKTCERMLKHLGKTASVESIRPDDLMRLRRVFSKTMGSTTLGNEITRVRSVLKYAWENAFIDAPLRFGDFKRPTRRVIRLAKAEAGPKMFEADEIRKLLDIADVQLRAMILLGVNCGFGNSDCGRLPENTLDLQGGWINYARGKTGIMRRCPLWPETVEALQTALNVRKSADDELVFRTKYGQSWFQDTGGCPVSAEFRKLCQQAEVYKADRGFYGLRHTLQTIGDEAGDYLAVHKIMGHVDGSIAGHYRERFADARLVAVTDHVRAWLFLKA